MLEPGRKERKECTLKLDDVLSLPARIPLSGGLLDIHTGVSSKHALPSQNTLSPVSDTWNESLLPCSLFVFCLG